MSLAQGTRVGPYEVGASIGAGGMGEVYRAHDTRLNRDVALKILPEMFAHDPERLARFKREAQVLASLNHPNIAHVYGVEDSPAGPALVMELVDGATLAEVITRSRGAEAPRLRPTGDSRSPGPSGPGTAGHALQLPDALAIARQIADALDAAHEHGIVHRDLKPANVKVKDDGTVKVLDFGLAKAFGPEGASGSGTPSLSNSPTLTSPAATAFGMILGTAAYMSPEQARGRAVDKRSDIWAFGCVLYEMLTGQSAFPGEDVAETIGAVIHKEPDWSALPPATPPSVRTIIERCLRKDPRQRLRDIGDVKLALDGAFDTAAVAGPNLAPVAAAPRWRSIAVFSLIALALAAATGLSVWLLMRPDPPAVVRLTASHSGSDIVGGLGQDIAVSADGRRIAYLAGPPGQKQIYVRALDQLVPARLGSPGPIPAVFFSPDGQWVGFTEGSDRSIKKVSVSGGATITICKDLTTVPLAPTWGVGDRIVFTQNSQFGPGLWIVPAGGGKPEPLLVPDANTPETYSLPEFLPGGESILFSSVPRGGGIDDHRIEVLDLGTKTRRLVVPGATHARYATSGHLVYLADEALRAIRFDLDRLEVIGSAVPVVESVTFKPNGITSYDISDTGTLVYIEGLRDQGKRTVVWVDRQGREEAIALPPRRYAYARLSPDETRLALDIRDEQNDIWIWDLGRKTLTRLTFDPGLNRGPVWSPDGKRVAFSAAQSTTENVQWQLADGSSPAQALTTLERGSLVPRSFSPDGSKLIVGPGTVPFDLQVLKLGGQHAVEPLLTGPFNENTGEISNDGRWVAYSSDESGRNEIYVRPFPDVNTARWQISTDGGTRALWSRNGRELFYSTVQGFGPTAPASTSAVMSVPIQPGATFSFGTPTAVVRGPYLAPQTGRHYDASKDGRFLMIKGVRTPEELAAPPQIVVVQNWTEELKKLAP